MPVALEVSPGPLVLQVRSFKSQVKSSTFRASRQLLNFSSQPKVPEQVRHRSADTPIMPHDSPLARASAAFHRQAQRMGSCMCVNGSCPAGSKSQLPPARSMHITQQPRTFREVCRHGRSIQVGRRDGRRLFKVVSQQLMHRPSIYDFMPHSL